MKPIRPIILALMLASFTGPLHAAPKKSGKDATDWKTVAKASEGKTLPVSVNATGDIGAVSTGAAYAVVPVTALNADNREYPEISVLMAPDKVQAFIKSVEPKQGGKRGTFGSKIIPGTFTATFVTIQGEPALVYGDVKPEMKLKKPSEILAAQLAAAKSDTTEKPTPAPEPAKPRKPTR